jgi:hypothetical protein
VIKMNYPAASCGVSTAINFYHRSKHIAGLDPERLNCRGRFCTCPLGKDNSKGYASIDMFNFGIMARNKPSTQKGQFWESYPEMEYITESL